MEPHPWRQVAQRGERSGWEQKAHLQGGLGSEKWGLRVGTGGWRSGQNLTKLGCKRARWWQSFRSGPSCSAPAALAHGAVRDATAEPVPLLVLHQDAAHQVLGAGQGTPGGQLVGMDRSRLLGALTPTLHPSSEPHTGYPVQRVDEQQSILKDGAAVLGHLGLLFCPVGPRSEVEVPGVKLKSPEWVRGWQDH